VSDSHFESPERVLSEAQRAYLEWWCQHCAILLGLAGWNVSVTAFWHGRDDAHAVSHVQDAADYIEIALDRGFLERHELAQRRTLAHELLHPHFYRITRLQERLVEGELGHRTEAILELAVELLEEQTITRLGDAIAEMLPAIAMPS